MKVPEFSNNQNLLIGQKPEKLGIIKSRSPGRGHGGLQKQLTLTKLNSLSVLCNFLTLTNVKNKKTNNNTPVEYKRLWMLFKAYITEYVLFA